MRARDYREIARRNLTGKWGVAILAALLAMILGGLLADGSMTLELRLSEETTYTIPHYFSWIVGTLGIGFVLGIIRFIVGGVVRLGYATFLLKQHDGQDADPEDLLGHFNHFGDGFILDLLTAIYTFLWMLLLIIPGIIAAYSYSMAPFIMVENPGMSPSEAITASKQLMDGHKWELFCLDFSFIGWILLGALTFGIGSLFVTPYMNAAYAAFYRQISHTY